MKKTFFLAVFTANLLFTSCNSTNEEQASENSTTPTCVDTFLSPPKEKVQANTETLVGKDDFQKIVSYIEKNGELLTERGVKCDHQVTFFDSKGNRHAMITIKRDSAGISSTKGIVDQISVWAYKKGIKDQKHFFGYYISKEKIDLFVPDLHSNKEDSENMIFGYQEFLKKVKKEN